MPSGRLQMRRMRWHLFPCLMAMLVTFSLPLMLFRFAAAQQHLLREPPLNKEFHQQTAEGLLKSWHFAQFLYVAGAPCKGSCYEVVAMVSLMHQFHRKCRLAVTQRQPGLCFSLNRLPVHAPQSLLLQQTQSLLETPSSCRQR